MVNAALDTHRPDADDSITVNASNWYFAVCAVMTVSMLAFAAMMFRQPRTHRVFHYITILIVAVTAIAYFTMGSNLGDTPVQVEFQRDSTTRSTRQVFYARYIDWVITTPLLLLDLLMTAGLPWPTILWTIVVDEIMIVTGLIGALVFSSYKWGYFVFSCMALFLVLFNILWVGRKHAAVLGTDINKLYLTCAGLTIVLWLLYPVAWGLSEGGNVITADGEAYFYGVLDLLAKPLFGFLLLLGHRKIDPARLGLRFRGYADPPTHSAEKHNLNGHNTNGVNGTTTTNGVHTDGVYTNTV